MPKRKAKRPAPSTSAERQARRTAALDAIAQTHGYPSWGQLSTAVKQGRARLTVNRV